MRKVLLFTMLLILGISLSSNIFAQVTVTLGEGTQANTTTGSPTPYGTWYKNFRQQYLVKATELNDIGGGPGNINSVGFFVQALNTCSPMPNFRVRVKATTQTALTSNFETGTYTEVFQVAEFMPIQGWNTHTFNAPFNWDGASNLLIDVVTDMIPGSYSQNASVNYTPTVFNSALRYESDYDPAISGTSGTTSLFRANMQINMEALDITDLAGLGIDGPSTPNVNSTVNYTVSVKNYSQNAVSNYTVKLMQVGDVEIGSVDGTSIDPMETLDFTIPWTPTVVGETQLFGKVVMAGDENPANDETPMFTVNVMESGLLVASIGNGSEVNGTTGTPTPYGTFYKNFRQQYLYTAADFYSAGAAPGLIQSLAFNVDNVNGCSPMPNYTIRLKHTDLEALTTTFEVGDYETVVTYTEYMPVNGWNLHVFSEPFFWDGASNLIVEVVTDLIPGDWTQNASVFHTTQSYASALRYQSDSSPASGGTTGSVASLLANARFYMVIEGMGSLSGTVTAGGTPLAGATIEVEDTVFGTVSGADGSYTIPFVAEGTHTVTATKHGYDEVSHTVNIVEDQNTVQDFALTLLPQVAVTGRIVGSDAPTVGLADATITLSGYESYEATTDASGNFNIADVFTGHTYNYTASAVGYSTVSGTVDVGSTPVNMGDVIVNEIAYPASQVVATESDDYSYVTLEWQAPNPNAVDITEGFEGAEFPPADWSQIITDSGPANSLGVYPTWCQAGNITLDPPVPPNSGDYQAAMWWSYSHQDEWLITPEFTCPGGASFTFWSYVYYGSTNGDHYYIKVSTDGGNNWTALWDASAQTPEGQIAYDMPITIDLSDYAGQDIKVAFHAEDPPSNDGMWHVWFVDDVHIGSPTQRITFSSEQLTTSKDRPAMTRGTAQTLPISRDPNYITHNSARSMERSLQGYHVYRLLAADQANEANWEQLTPAGGYAQTSMADNAWGPLPSGVYKYAVKALYTNDVMSTPAFSNELHKGMMGTLTGVVTEFGTDLPVEGATITAGEYSGTTDASGEYSFAVYAGTYTVTAAKAGYQTETQTSVSITGLETTTLDFVITELTLPPAAVQAEEAGNNVNITWMAPGTAGGEWLHYDSGENDDSIGTGAAADFDVAVRFPPSALTEYAGMSLHALNVWPAQAGTFTLKVWTGGTAAAPATLVLEQPFTPVLDTYNTVVLDNPVMITGDEELWFGYNCNVTSGYPAGCDAGPATDGFGNMMYFQGEWTTLLALNPDLNYNWNIQGYVGYGAPDRDSWIAIDARSNQEAANAERAMEGYKVWRLMQGQESNEAQWTSLTPDPISATAFQDTQWGDTPDGTYKWAVKAVYTGGALSNSAFSNAIERITEIGTVAGFVRDMDNNAISGATISTGNYTATSNAQGAYSMAVPAGTHTLVASHPNFSAVSQSGVVVVTGQTTTVNFNLPPSVVVFEDDFEAYPDFSLTFAPWTLVDVDQSTTYGFSGITFPNSGSAMAWIIFNPDATTPPVDEAAAHSGSKYAASFASVTPPNNDWMITPQVPGGGDISFFAKSFTHDYGVERFKVGVSTTGTNPADFTIISGANYIEAPLNWTEYSYSLGDYAEQNIYVGIQCVSNDAFILFVDDVTITGSVSNEDGVAPVFTTELKGNYPNPFNPETTIRYSVRENSPVTIDIFNVRGQRVRRLVNETVNAGDHTVVWHGTDDNGRSVSSGIYYFKMNAGKYSSTKKMIMMK
jgi:hypothetical protein